MSSNFWETIWQILVVFVLVAYLIVLFQIIVDLFRDKKLGGFSKAIWFLGLIFVPIFTALLYILFRGRGMSERQIEAVKEARAETDAYIRSVAGSKSPTEQIAEAKSLLDSGAISAGSCVARYRRCGVIALHCSGVRCPPGRQFGRGR